MTSDDNNDTTYHIANRAGAPVPIDDLPGNLPARAIAKIKELRQHARAKPEQPYIVMRPPAEDPETADTLGALWVAGLVKFIIQKDESTGAACMLVVPSEFVRGDAA